jgi:hypothetical protein
MEVNVTVHLEDYISEIFRGQSVLLVASYEAAYALAHAHLHKFDFIIAFNCRTDKQPPSFLNNKITHWCVNLGCKLRAVPKDIPIISPYHERWGSLSKAQNFFENKGTSFMHPLSDLFPFEFQEIAETLDRCKQPSVGIYLTRRLINAGINPTLVGFTGGVKSNYHDPQFEKRVLEKLEKNELIRRIK